MKTFQEFTELVEEILDNDDYKLSVESELDEDEIEEDAPTNNVGGGAIAGAGVGPDGEPGVARDRKSRKKYPFGLMNGPEVDPRLFADKVYKRGSMKEEEQTRNTHT